MFYRKFQMPNITNSLLGIFFLLLFACNKSIQSVTMNENSQECVDKPTTSLKSKDVENIVPNEVITVSRRVRAGQNFGYQFEAKSGQKLSLRTDQDICVWVFAPDTSIVNGTELPQDGKYIVQVSALQGYVTYEIAIGLDVDQQVSLASPAVESPEPIAQTPAPRTTSQSNTAQNDLTQSEATELVQNWLNSKSQVFAPPWNRSLVQKYTTGSLYQDITKPGGSIDWLSNNSSYYQFEASQITDVWQFDSSGSQPWLKIRIY